MVGFGIPQADICAVIGIAKGTLEKHFRAEIDQGAAKANAKVVESLYNQATGGNVTAAIWWTKARMQWSEKIVKEIHVKPVEDMTHEELVAFCAEDFDEGTADPDSALSRAKPLGNA